MLESLAGSVSGGSVGANVEGAAGSVDTLSARAGAVSVGESALVLPPVDKVSVESVSGCYVIMRLEMM